MSSSVDSLTISISSTTTESPVNLLTDDCLRLILSRFSLIEQLQLRSVCRRWHFVCEQLFHGKRSLKLFDSHASVQRFYSVISNFKPAEKLVELSSVGKDIRSDDIVVKDGNEHCMKACQFIPQLFPNVANFIVVCPKLFQVNEIVDLLDQMSHCLACLVTFSMPKQVPKGLWPQIAALPKLQKLFLTRMYHHPEIPQKLFPMPVMSNLRQFAIGYYKHDVVPILAQLGPQLEILGLSWITLNAKQFEKLLNQNPGICTNLKELHFSGMISSTDGVNRLDNFRAIMELACDKFRELTCVNILYADQLPLTTIIPILSKLPNLTKLCFYIGAHQLEPEPSTELGRLLQLRTVQTLYLEIYDLTPDLFCQWVGRIVPNVSHLTVKCVDWLEGSVQIEHKLRTEFKCLSTLLFV